MKESLKPERAAAQLLQQVNCGEPPIDVLHIAEEHEGLDVQEHPDPRAVAGVDLKLAPKGLSGLLLPTDRRIWVNADEAARSKARARFTIAHELGHWHLHRTGKRDRARFCRPGDVGVATIGLQSSGRLEAEANRFAAELLMPKWMVRERAADSRLSVPGLAHVFGVSAAAMQVRLEFLDLLPEYMRTK